MKKVLLFIGCCLLVAALSAQTITQKLQKAFQQFENDSQLKHAISSLYVIDAKTGQVVFDKNAQVGLAPASTQKIITSVTAFELLGRDYRYKTDIILNGRMSHDTLFGDIIFRGEGDPTFGSWRYPGTTRDKILQSIVYVLKDENVKNVTGNIIVDDLNFETQSIPDGWIWQDIGNYYGAGAGALCWNENQYEIVLEPGNKIGASTKIINTIPTLEVYSLINEIKTGPKGSGDNGYIYIAPYTINGFLRGTIPLGEQNFKISGSFPNPSGQFNKELEKKLSAHGITVNNKYMTGLDFITNNKEPNYKGISVFSQVSPSLDSIIYWLNKKSINLYAEALIKTFAYEKQGFGSTDSGVAIVKKFWKDKGLDEDELNIYDGSGLSPLNRITTHAQVEILKYAKTKAWFQYFYNSLPDYNGMRMKSGTISDVKGFCGYHKANNGKEYIFSFLVNNYSGKTSGVVNKMYKVLDELK